jgi:hypothetical protein
MTDDKACSPAYIKLVPDTLHTSSTLRAVQLQATPLKDFPPHAAQHTALIGANFVHCPSAGKLITETIQNV